MSTSTTITSAKSIVSVWGVIHNEKWASAVRANGKWPTRVPAKPKAKSTVEPLESHAAVMVLEFVDDLSSRTWAVAETTWDAGLPHQMRRELSLVPWDYGGSEANLVEHLALTGFKVFAQPFGCSMGSSIYVSVNSLALPGSDFWIKSVWFEMELNLWHPLKEYSGWPRIKCTQLCLHLYLNSWGFPYFMVDWLVD